jgi:hypothetical protein
MVNIWYGEKYSNEMALTTNPEPQIIVTKISPICPFLLSVISLPLSVDKDTFRIAFLPMNNPGVLIHFTRHSLRRQERFRTKKLPVRLFSRIGSF